VAAIGSSAQRSTSTPSARGNAVVRRRLVLGVLCVLSLALVTVYFRESDGGFLHGLQSTGASVLRPFEVAADRVASPFEDAASWFGGLLHAKSDNKKLRKEVDRLRAQAIVNVSALRENAQLKQQLKYLESPRYPQDYRPVVARVIARAPSHFAQQIVVSAGKNQGISKHDAVVTAEGLVDQVTKDQVVNRGDVLVTAGWRSGDLSSLYPRGVQVCQVTQVGQSDTDLYKQIQCDPFVHFSTLEAVIVLVRKADSK
jgi:rod shape-determining protein MreC